MAAENVGLKDIAYRTDASVGNQIPGQTRVPFHCLSLLRERRGNMEMGNGGKVSVMHFEKRGFSPRNPQRAEIEISACSGGGWPVE